MKVKIKKFPKDHNKKRKVDVQVDGFDTWNLDHTLALIIHPALVKFKEENTFALLQVEDVDLPPNFAKENAVDEDSMPEEAATNRMNWLIDELIWTFAQITGNNDWEEVYFEKEAYENGYDIEGHQAHWKRIQNGLKLFGKYYLALWW
jgi:hypothetical protein